MHAQLFGGFALVALVMSEDFEKVAPLELPNRLRVGNAGTMHLRNQAVQFAFQITLASQRRSAATDS